MLRTHTTWRVILAIQMTRTLSVITLAISFGVFSAERVPCSYSVGWYGHGTAFVIFKNRIEDNV